MCSPVLFSLFINDLALDIINNDRRGVSLSSDGCGMFEYIY